MGTEEKIIGEGQGTETGTGKEGDAKTDKGKESELDPSKIPQQTIEQTAAFKGLASEKNQLRQERAALQTQLAVAQQQVQTLQAEPLEEPEEPFELESAEDAEQAIKDNRKRVAELKTEVAGLKTELTEDKQVRRVERSDASVEKARQEYSADKVGQDMSWDAVVNVGLPAVVKKYGHEFVKTLNDGDALYKLCLITSSELAEKSKAILQADIIETFKKGGTGPKTGGGTAPVTFNVKAVSISELDKKLNELEDNE